MSTSYKYYNFEIKKPEQESDLPFCIMYNKKIPFIEGFSDSYDITTEKQLSYIFDNIKMIDLIYFCLDYFSFRKSISSLMYKITNQNTEPFFFSFMEFDNYCVMFNKLMEKPINALIKSLLHNDQLSEVENLLLYENEKLPDVEFFNKAERKIISLIEKIYNKQRTFSSNLIINSRIHAVVAYYPNFGRHFDKMKNELGIFIESDDGEHLILNKGKNAHYTILFLVQYFGFQKNPAEWKPIGILFDIGYKVLSSSFQNVKDEPTEYYLNILKDLES
jgi:hypothetical protein